MSGVTHVRLEFLRTVRNRRLLVFSLALPLVLFYAVASAQRHAHTDGISFPLFFMVGMAAYGALFAAVGPGARIAVDRARGWTRQLRITPLPVRVYFIARVLSAYVVALPSLIVLYLAGTSLGVHLSAGQYLARDAAFVLCLYITAVSVAGLGARSVPIVATLAVAALLVPAVIPSWHTTVGNALGTVTPGHPGCRDRNVRNSAAVRRQSCAGRGTSRVGAPFGGERAHPDRQGPP